MWGGAQKLKIVKKDQSCSMLSIYIVLSLQES